MIITSGDPEDFKSQKSRLSVETLLGFKPHSFLSYFLPDFSADFQLLAIRELLRTHNDAEEAICLEIKELEKHAEQLSGIPASLAYDDWANRMHDLTYLDAAHSTAAVGMLAPLLETLFCRFFNKTREFWKDREFISHPRLQLSPDDFWDCSTIQTSSGSMKNLVQGILELVDITGLKDKLPLDLDKTLAALFEYRNKMFHCGLEWPLLERRGFEKRITEAQWPKEWFCKSSVDSEPWIFYMSSVFIEHCLKTIDQVLDVLDLFAGDEFARVCRDWREQ